MHMLSGAKLKPLHVLSVRGAAWCMSCKCTIRHTHAHSANMHPTLLALCDMINPHTIRVKVTGSGPKLNMCGTKIKPSKNSLQGQCWRDGSRHGAAYSLSTTAHLVTKDPAHRSSPKVFEEIGQPGKAEHMHRLGQLLAGVTVHDAA